MPLNDFMPGCDTISTDAIAMNYAIVYAAPNNTIGISIKVVNNACVCVCVWVTLVSDGEFQTNPLENNYHIMLLKWSEFQQAPVIASFYYSLGFQ